MVMAMKKIGLCVCYDTKNFGSQLQVLATQEMVKELGYDYEIIRYGKKLTPSFLLKSVPRLLNPNFLSGKIRKLKKNRALKKYPDIRKNVKIRNQRFERFAKKYFDHMSPVYKGWAELEKGTENYDAFLCGSDQLWLPGNLGSHFYTLEFVPYEKSKIAYATSFGVSRIPWYQKKRTARYLERFQALSTREVRGSEMIQELAGLSSSVVCDPTLLFDAEQWSKLIPVRPVVKEPYIFCYFLGTNPKHRKIALELKKATGLKVVTIPFLDHFVQEDVKFGDRRLYDVDAEDFVNLIRHAEYVLTDSFHGSVFSILHHRQFITLNRFDDNSGNSRNSRIDSLCALLGLSGRRYHGDIQNAIQGQIDYEAVEKKLSDLRADSILYLKNALKQA